MRVKRKALSGCLSDVVVDVKQVFQVVPDVLSFDSAEDMRFAYFKESVLAPLLRVEQSRTLIVTPSYISYVRVRNELLSQDVNAAFVCEYSRTSEISRGRSRFFQGMTDVLLYSGRAHFFKRLRIRGARHIVFYSLPQYASFYAELVNMVSPTDGSSGEAASAAQMSCTVLYTQYERMALERIVGQKRCAHMMASTKTTFMFCS